MRESYADANVKANELLFRRLDVEDAASAHLLARERAPALGFRRYVISATPPLGRGDLAAIRSDPPAVGRRLVPQYEGVSAARGWHMRSGRRRGGQEWDSQ